jgi:hypothetical protein
MKVKNVKIYFARIGNSTGNQKSINVKAHKNEKNIRK